MPKSLLEILHKLPVDVIVDFKKNGKSTAIPKHIQNYILELDKAAEVFDESKGRMKVAIEELRNAYVQLSYSTARSRIYDAINYFHLNSTVKEEAWDNYYADRMEELAQKALDIKDPNITEARRCMERAMQYRKEASRIAINPEDFKPHIFLIDPRITPEMLGIENQNLKQIWNKSEELIEKMPLNAQEKDKLKREAAENLGIEDVDFEELDSHE